MEEKTSVATEKADGAKDCDPESTPIMVNREQAAAMCGVGKSLWHELASSGRTPAPLRLGRRVLWLRDELVAWCNAGCPNREKWEIMKS